MDDILMHQRPRVAQIFWQWEGEVLSADNKRQLWVQEGFAHVFVVLSDTPEFLYKTTDYNSSVLERSIAWNDSIIGILRPDGMAPVLSVKNAQAQAFAQAEVPT